MCLFSLPLYITLDAAPGKDIFSKAASLPYPPVQTKHRAKHKGLKQPLRCNIRRESVHARGFCFVLFSP